MDLSKNLIRKKIAILGAGVIGLSTAERLIEKYNEFNLAKQGPIDLTIISEAFGKETTSDGAGGLFRPDDRFIPGVAKDLVKKWATDSFNYFDQLLFSREGGKAGVFQASGYQMFDDERFVKIFKKFILILLNFKKDPSYKEYVYQFRQLTKKELESFPRKFK